MSSYNIDDRLDEGLVRCGMPVVTFSQLARLAGIAGASPARLFQSFRGEKSLPTATAIRLWQLFREIESLSKSVAPLKLDLTDPVVVNQWLLDRRNGVLQVTVEHGTKEIADLAE
jgi:hypothetical protein